MRLLRGLPEVASLPSLPIAAVGSDWLALSGRNRGERSYLLGHALAAAVRADYAALSRSVM